MRADLILRSVSCLARIASGGVVRYPLRQVARRCFLQAGRRSALPAAGMPGLRRFAPFPRVPRAYLGGAARRSVAGPFPFNLGPWERQYLSAKSKVEAAITTEQERLGRSLLSYELAKIRRPLSELANRYLMGGHDRASPAAKEAARRAWEQLGADLTKGADWMMRQERPPVKTDLIEGWLGWRRFLVAESRKRGNLPLHDHSLADQQRIVGSLFLSINAKWISLRRATRAIAPLAKTATTSRSVPNPMEPGELELAFHRLERQHGDSMAVATGNTPRKRGQLRVDPARAPGQTAADAIRAASTIVAGLKDEQRALALRYIGTGVPGATRRLTRELEAARGFLTGRPILDPRGRARATDWLAFREYVVEVLKESTIVVPLRRLLREVKDRLSGLLLR